MNQTIKKIGFTALYILSVCTTKAFSQNTVSTGHSASNEQVKLAIGDNAPKLAYSKWIQGNPVSEMTNDKTYVVEFWASWCGPCIHAMPHLSELAKKYGEAYVFIGCNVLEKVGNKPYESILPKVTSFVQKQKALGRLTYNVIADNNAQDMDKNWLVAAGIEGIPVTFVINKGKVAWMGHPDFLGDILASIENGSFDIEKSKKQYAEQNDPGVKFQQKLKENKDRISKAETEKDYAKALQYVDEAKASQPEFKFMYIEDEFRVLLDHYGEERAMQYGDQIIKNGGVSLEVFVACLYEKKDMSAKMNQYAVKVARSMKQDFPKAFHIIASFEDRAGYYAEAAVSEQKAIDQAKILMKEKPDMEGFFNADVMKEYQNKVDEYKKKAIK
ncbi:redoxin domain-containing protein [Flavobacterium sp. FlaQc-48]|uniref:redoxin domain-containing protein n=1 Tax=Flavobacterium sp. FlaQc-48 TaxID=3374181 RepID=UPI0037578812